MSAVRRAPERGDADTPAPPGAPRTPIDPPSGRSPTQRTEGVAAWVLVAIAGALTLGVAGLRLADSLAADLDVYRAGGAAVLAGRSLYDSSFSAGLVLPSHFSFTYPPAAALGFIPLSWMPLPVAFVLWTVASVAATAWLVLTLTHAVRERVPAHLGMQARCAVVIAALAAGPLQEHFAVGQVGVLIVAACWWDLVVSPTTRRTRGLLVGICAAIKMVPALLIAYLLLTRQWRAAVVAGTTMAAAWALAAVLLPGDTSRYFFGGVMTDTQRLGFISRYTNQSWGGLLARHGSGPGARLWWVLAIVTIVVGLAAATVMFLRTGQNASAITVLMLLAVAATPVAWVHHAVWLLPALAVLLGDATVRWRTYLSAALAGFLLIPLEFSIGLGVPIISEAYLLIYLLVATAVFRSALSSPSPLPASSSARKVAA